MRAGMAAIVGVPIKWCVIALECVVAVAVQIAWQPRRCRQVRAWASWLMSDGHVSGATVKYPGRVEWWRLCSERTRWASAGTFSDVDARIVGSCAGIRAVLRSAGMALGTTGCCRATCSHPRAETSSEVCALQPVTSIAAHRSAGGSRSRVPRRGIAKRRGAPLTGEGQRGEWAAAEATGGTALECSDAPDDAYSLVVEGPSSS
jgi:hypothetical protein